MPLKMHPDVTVDKVLTAVKRDDCLGFCVQCGTETGGVEPDARNYPCEGCGTNGVFGAEELLLMMDP